MTDSYNTLLRLDCMRALTTGSSTNVAVGTAIAYNATTAMGNVYVGHQCGLNAANVNYNTGVGNNALQNVTSHDNTAVGQSALVGVTTGTWNMGVGRGAGSSGSLVTGSSNTLIGRNTNPATANISNSCAIGAGATVDAETTRFSWVIHLLQRSRQVEIW